MCDYSRFTHRAFRHGFGFMAGAGRFFGPGEVRLALLSLLADEPMHGYQLMRRLEERSGGIYRVSAGTVYPTLQQLEDEGLIISELQDSKGFQEGLQADRRRAARTCGSRRDRTTDLAAGAAMGGLASCL